jgi:excisionase family DNA binding protein
MPLPCACHSTPNSGKYQTAANETYRPKEATVNIQEQQDLLTVDETIRVLRLGRTRVNEMLRGGELPSIKIGHRRFVRRIDLEHFLDAHEYRPGEE